MPMTLPEWMKSTAMGKTKFSSTNNVSTGQDMTHVISFKVTEIWIFFQKLELIKIKIFDKSLAPKSKLNKNDAFRLENA